MSETKPTFQEKIEIGWKRFTIWSAAILLLLYLVAALSGWTAQDTYYLPLFLAGYVSTFLSTPIVVSITKLLDSNFSSALFGAGLGSYTAYIFSRRGKEFDDREQEIKFSNQGVLSAGNIANAAAGFKRQQTLPIRARYDKALKEFLSFEDRKHAGTLNPDEYYTLLADYQNLSTFRGPIEVLLRACEHTSPDGMVMMMAYTLQQSIEQLNEVIETRGSLIAEVKQLPPDAVKKRLALYFGHEHENGHDVRFKNIIEAIDSFTDDCIFFSVKVCHGFTAHGKKLRANNKRHSTIRAFDFDKMGASDVIPPDANYESWLPKKGKTQ
jgi:hypothetical protein